MKLRERFFPKRKIVLDFTAPFRLRTDYDDREWPDTAQFHWQVPDDGAIKLISLNVQYTATIGLGTRTCEVTAYRGDKVLSYLGKSGTIPNAQTCRFFLFDNGPSLHVPARGNWIGWSLPSNLYLLPRDQLRFKILLGAATDYPKYIWAFYQLWEYD